MFASIIVGIITYAPYASWSYVFHMHVKNWGSLQIHKKYNRLND